MCDRLKNVEAIQHIQGEHDPNRPREGTLGALDRALNTFWRNQVVPAPANDGELIEAFRTLQRQAIAGPRIEAPIDYRRNP